MATEPLGWHREPLLRYEPGDLVLCNVCGEKTAIEDLVLDLLPSVRVCIYCEAESFDASDCLF
jgi:RNA polymerase-binding transcription factor DksA